MVLIVSIYISVYFNYELDKKLCKRYNYKVTKDDILGKNRSRDISYPRQICMYLCEKYTEP